MPHPLQWLNLPLLLSNRHNHQLLAHQSPLLLREHQVLQRHQPLLKPLPLLQHPLHPLLEAAVLLVWSPSFLSVLIMLVFAVIPPCLTSSIAERNALLGSIQGFSKAGLKKGTFYYPVPCILITYFYNSWNKWQKRVGRCARGKIACYSYYYYSTNNKSICRKPRLLLAVKHKILAVEVEAQEQAQPPVEAVQVQLLPQEEEETRWWQKCWRSEMQWYIIACSFIASVIVIVRALLLRYRHSNRKLLWWSMN